MKRSSLAEIADRMKGIDIAILSTHADGGEIANRPMSNNGDVAYNGDSYLFTHENARCVTRHSARSQGSTELFRQGGNIFRRRHICRRRRPG